MSTATKVPVIWPLVPRPRFWMTPELRPLQEKIDAGAPLSSDETIFYHRERGLRDLYFFVKFCMGFDLLEPHLHAPVAWTWQAPNGRYGRRMLTDDRLGLLARTSYKTTLCTQGWACWMITRNPEERGLIYTHSYTFAQKIMAPIRALYEGHGPKGQFFLACYGDRVPPKTERAKWTENVITLKRQGAYTDATLEATGMGAKIVGGHFTFEALDDVQERRESREMIDKLADVIDNLEPMLMPGCPRRTVATHWDFYDLYFRMKRYKKGLTVFQVPYKTGDTWTLRAMAQKAPELEALKRRNPLLFSAWYNLHPQDEDKQGFLRAWFRTARRTGDTLTELDQDGKPTERTLSLPALPCYILIDPNAGDDPTATTKKESQDFVGLVVLHVGPDNRRYVTRAIKARWNTDDFVEAVFRLVGYWKPRWVGIEKDCAQRLYLHLFRMHFRQGRPPFQLVPLESGGKSKIHVRIRGLIDYYSNGMVWHVEDDQRASGLPGARDPGVGGGAGGLAVRRARRPLRRARVHDSVRPGAEHAVSHARAESLGAERRSPAARRRQRARVGDRPPRAEGARGRRGRRRVAGGVRAPMTESQFTTLLNHVRVIEWCLMYVAAFITVYAIKRSR